MLSWRNQISMTGIRSQRSMKRADANGVFALGYGSFLGRRLHQLLMLTRWPVYWRLPLWLASWAALHLMNQSSPPRPVLFLSFMLIFQPSGFR